ncbi:hypothetical protein GCM10011583_45590 [Streptomyces camponoticapitis]|uniref:Uncharacterized protein n=1 Tax=Streptomyces camponoticapitis TaxID=1616125 RepID=A0ABQ2EEN8_9ACTN|nr:hypothetical protein GCM10011583_45590 [Streptomyces camponoticapitis]
MGLLQHHLRNLPAQVGVVADELAYHHEAAGTQEIHDARDEVTRSGGVGNAVQNGVEEDTDRLFKVDETLEVGMLQDVFGLQHVRRDDHAPVVLVEDRLPVREYDGVVVHIDDM